MNNPTQKLLGSAGTLALTLALAACGSSSSTSSMATGSAQSPKSTSAAASPPASGPVAVVISGYAYHPVALTVAAGTRISFTNHDATAHTATSSSPVFDTGTVKPGQSVTVTLKTAGTYSYICQFHPFMHGTVTVK